MLGVLDHAIGLGPGFGLDAGAGFAPGNAPQAPGRNEAGADERERTETHFFATPRDRM